MTSRQEISARKEALVQELRGAYATAVESSCPVSISQRDLGARYRLSVRTVSLLLQELSAEGLLYTLPRVGTFLGKAPVANLKPFVFSMPYRTGPEGQISQVQAGFEDQIALLGGLSLSLLTEELSAGLEDASLPQLAGLLSFRARHKNLKVPHGTPLVEFADGEENTPLADVVNFDNQEGGTLAARHLLQMGHREIAFLGLHRGEEPNRFAWSALREQGWKRVLDQAGCRTDGRSFHPLRQAGLEPWAQIEPAREAAGLILQTSGVTAVVTANAHAARGVLQACQDRGLPRGSWPAIVCFDEAPGTGVSVVSYVRLPWEELGRQAAQLLWERSRGTLQEAPVTRLIAPRLIPRLSCRSHWADSGGFASLQVSHLGGESREFSVSRPVSSTT